MTDPLSFLPLHPVEMQVLLVLVEGEAHAYHIVAEIERRDPAVRVYPANLYRRVRDMAEAGLLEEVPVPAEADARRRRYYAVTELGRAVAREESARLERVLVAARAAGLAPARP